jgi:CPA1 family monovalent cation:H+ antiporter
MMTDVKALPQRDLIVFLTFCVILVTLVLQGITLTPLVRWLGLAGVGGPNCEELEARRLVTDAAVLHLETARVKDAEEFDEIYEDLIGHYRHRLASLMPEDQRGVTHHHRFTEISREAAQVERDTAVRLRNEGRINDEVLRRIERELDLDDSRFSEAREG